MVARPYTYSLTCSTSWSSSCTSSFLVKSMPIRLIACYFTYFSSVVIRSISSATLLHYRVGTSNYHAFFMYSAPVMIFSRKTKYKVWAMANILARFWLWFCWAHCWSTLSSLSSCTGLPLCSLCHHWQCASATQTYLHVIILFCQIRSPLVID